MNITINIDCTPEEARRFMGLPDLTAVHDSYLEKVRTAIDSGVTPDMIDGMMRSWAPMGEAGMAMWRQLFDQMRGTGKT